MLGEGLNPLEGFVLSGTLPIREQLPAVEPRPLLHELELPARERARDDCAVDDADRRRFAGALGVKVRDGVVTLVPEHRDRFTGLRRGELVALRWRDVDFAGSVIRVRASYAGGELTSPKSGKVRSVPLAPVVASALAALGQRVDWVGDDDLVFVGATGGYLDGSALRRRYGAALARAGLRPLRFHDLRHTFGTRMIAKADIRRVQEWMGHADVQTTKAAVR